MRLYITANICLTLWIVIGSQADPKIFVAKLSLLVSASHVRLVPLCERSGQEPA
jgi:metal-responsive CopG/Arc/MetJ family transcriptional regulator